jgi:hypothetical protein
VKAVDKVERQREKNDSVDNQKISHQPPESRPFRFAVRLSRGEGHITRTPESLDHILPGRLVKMRALTGSLGTAKDFGSLPFQLRGGPFPYITEFLDLARGT